MRRGRPKLGFLRIPKRHPAIGKSVSIAGKCRRMRRISAFSRLTDYRQIIRCAGAILNRLEFYSLERKGYTLQFYAVKNHAEP